MSLLQSAQETFGIRPRRVGARTRRQINVGSLERKVSISAGGILALLGLSRMSLPGILVAGVGGAMIYRGTTGQCPAYSSLGISTAEGRIVSLRRRGIHIEEAMIINRSAEELFNFWRNFENLPRIMSHLHEVRRLDDRRSRWVAKAPAIVGGSAEWEAVITAEERGSRIAWRSVPGSQVESIGEVRFSKAMGDRGTEVHVYLDYQPPAGKLGHYIATLFGESPEREIREDLRSFKALMETGEIPTIAGQPRGTCAGRGGRRETM